MTRPIGYGASGAYASSFCHYCGDRATTDDHVVPQSAFVLLQSALPSWFRQHNVVPCCWPCNNFKANYRSDCECQQCTWVWTTALAHAAEWLKPKWMERRATVRNGIAVVQVRRVIKVGQSRQPWRRSDGVRPSV